MAEVNPLPLAIWTEIMGRHYTASLKDGDNNPQRTLMLFCDRVVADLKALPPAPPRTPKRSD